LGKYRKYKDFHRIENGIEQKQCQDCNEWFNMNTDNFNIVNGNKDGFNHRCKICQEIYQKEYYEKTREKQIEKSKEHRKENLQYIKDYRYVYNRESRNVIRKYNKSYHSTHKEDLKRNQKRFQQSESGKEKQKGYNEKRKIKNHKINPKEWVSCKDYFKNEDGEWCCAYCGMTEKEHKKLHKEQLHKEHVDDEGSNDLSNCVPACKSCNCSKHTYKLEEWYNEQNPKFDINKLNKIKRWLDNDWEQFYIEKKPKAAYGSRNKSK
jgi:hypothetical protein